MVQRNKRINDEFLVGKRKRVSKYSLEEMGCPWQDKGKGGLGFKELEKFKITLLTKMVDTANKEP